MCDVCHQYPCHPRCPNAPDPPSVFVCSGSGRDIYEGEDYWDLLGEQFSEGFIDSAWKEAECDQMCFICEEAVYEGENYYSIMGKTLCEHCVNDARREAVFDYDEDDYFGLG